MLIQGRANGAPAREAEAIRKSLDSAQARSGLEQWEATWARCWHRIRNWRVPARWSAWDWREEARAEGLLAACQANRDFDPARGVPREAFLYQRILARVWTRYRQEWSYGRLLRTPLRIEDYPTPGDAYASADDPDEVRGLVSELGERDRWLIRQLFWDGKTEAAIASDIGVSQQAVSQRKSHALKTLQRRAGLLP
jgi:RNA polymerase sigma factor (sigma-70 family)